MSLWTPYDPEQVLDLSKAAAMARVKLEPGLPRSPPAGAGPEPYPLQQYPQYLAGSPLLSPESLRLSTSSYGVSPPASSPDSSSGRHSAGSRPPRPFKAITAALPELGASSDPDPKFAAFRAAMLEAMRARNGGSLTVSNPRMRRSVHRSSDTGEDGDYLERRARNNAAAKRSRDLRKQKEDELAIRVAYLEQQNAELREDLAAAARRPCAGCLHRYNPY
ncbi:hypothetical protein JYU34_013932 [Plutella xylostella]|uniref:BZIP domain-containing protein n=1 Tax=Plutella xylostella TaxID=51655 RepID=A0ABQ7QB29_PLUXY|nr:hypothetical protein JYU34_013932 [Plutella xylostella]